MARVLVDSAVSPVTVDDEVALMAAELVTLLREYRRQLVGVATNLNQVAHHANTVSEVPADFAVVLRGVQEVHDRIDDILASVRR